MRHLPLLRGAAILVCATAFAACNSESHEVLGPTVPTGGALFRSYVSLGNSITAGYQSGGINDSTQRAAYPVLLAQAMGTSFVYPSLEMPGCPPPIANFQTGARLSNVPCALRNPALVSNRVNNVAVPGAWSFDPTSPTSPASNALTTLILGGETQVQRALQADPTFATVWIGNNDALPAALSGILAAVPNVSPGVTPLAAFSASYAAMMSALKAGAPDLKGVLIGVVQVAGAPAFVRGVVFTNPQVKFAINQAIKPDTVTVDTSCAASGAASLIDIVQMLPRMQAWAAGDHVNGVPPIIACVKGVYPAPIGDVFVLDAAEQTQLGGLITSYNDYIKAKADSLGFAYYDPNVRLGGWIQSGAIPPVPNFASPTAPFGPYISLDGIHPSSAAQKVLANDLIDLINSKFGTALKHIP